LHGFVNVNRKRLSVRAAVAAVVECQAVKPWRLPRYSGLKSFMRNASNSGGNREMISELSAQALDD
jgi:hypothetical protein